MFMTLARYKNENDVDVHEDVEWRWWWSWRISNTSSSECNGINIESIVDNGELPQMESMLTRK